MNDSTRLTVVTNITENAALTTPYAIINALATVVACYGMFENSPAVVIGAMLIATLLGPILAIALALVNGDLFLLGRAFAAEIVGALVVVGVALLIGLINRDIPLTDQILARTSPNILDLMIALAGGAAGAYCAVVPTLGSAIAGVAIATALVPPLATCGLCLARGELALAFGGFLLFFTNLVGIQAAASAVIAVFGFHKTAPQMEGRTGAALRAVPSLGILALLAAVPAFNFAQALHAQVLELGARSELIAALRPFPGADLADLRFRAHFSQDARVGLTAALEKFPGARLADLRYRSKLGKTVLIAVIRAPFYFDKDQVAAL